MIPTLQMFASVGMLITGNIPQIHLTRGTKILAGHSCHGIECDQASIERRFEDTASAQPVRRGQWIQPCRHTSIDKTIAIVKAPVDIGIIGPELLSCGRIKCDNPVEGSGEIQFSIDQNRRGLEPASLSAIATGGDVSGMEDPRYFELRDISAVDLRKN